MSGPISPTPLHCRKVATENVTEIPVALPSGPPEPPGKLLLLLVQVKGLHMFPEKAGFELCVCGTQWAGAGEVPFCGVVRNRSSGVRRPRCGCL